MPMACTLFDSLLGSPRDAARRTSERWSPIDPPRPRPGTPVLAEWEGATRGDSTAISRAVRARELASRGLSAARRRLERALTTFGVARRDTDTANPGTGSYPAQDRGA